MIKDKKPSVKPLVYLLPFPVTALLHISWLMQEYTPWSSFSIRDSALLVPFLTAWGLQFAHNVGRMILAHVTKGAFPVWNWLWIWTFIGAVDANLPRLGLQPFIQKDETSTTVFVYLTLLVNVVAYARFCTLVIWEVADYLGIACFTVRKKGSDGQWKNAAEVNGEAKGK
jgi:ethanolaminephosphotransferase